MIAVQTATQIRIIQSNNQTLARNAEMLKDSSIRVAKASEKGIVEIETLQTVHTSLIQTLEETIRIQQQGKAGRQDAEGALQGIEIELKKKLIELKG